MINSLLYIDPASTAIIWQLVAGFFIAFGVVLSIWWTKISTFVKGLFVKMSGKKNKKAKEPKEEIVDEELEDVTEKEMKPDEISVLDVQLNEETDDRAKAESKKQENTAVKDVNKKGKAGGVSKK